MYLLMLVLKHMVLLLIFTEVLKFHSPCRKAVRVAAPLKSLTLPRLELMAIVSASRVAKFVQTSLSPSNTPISALRRLWTDSQIVLATLATKWILCRPAERICGARGKFRMWGPCI